MSYRVEYVESASGLPFVLREEHLEFQRLAKEAFEALQELARGTVRASLRAEVGGALLILSTEEGERAMPAREVLLECRSATMRDELTGERRFKEQDIPQDVVAKAARMVACVLGMSWAVKGCFL